MGRRGRGWKQLYFGSNFALAQRQGGPSPPSVLVVPPSLQEPISAGVMIWTEGGEWEDSDFPMTPAGESGSQVAWRRRDWAAHSHPLESWRGRESTAVDLHTTCNCAILQQGRWVSHLESGKGGFKSPLSLLWLCRLREVTSPLWASLSLLLHGAHRSLLRGIGG